SDEFEAFRNAYLVIKDMVMNGDSLQKLKEEGIVEVTDSGDMRFVTKDACEVNDLIYTDYALANGKRFHHVAKILAIKPLENSSKDAKYECRCQFVDILNGEREMIIRYIFEEERKKRKRET
ncbi:MAG: phage portal protein, partial [Lachnospiraceae bacterium]|nr:phage portal protein [Lachnospiraceae bacterium]